MRSPSPMSVVPESSLSSPPLQRSSHSAKQMAHRPSKPAQPPHAARRLALRLTNPLASLALLLFAAAGLLLYYSQTTPASQIVARSSKEYGTASPALSFPTVEGINGARAIWELPAAPAKAVLFVAHGCRCRPENFWPPSPRCPGCVGLPEDVAITAGALRRRFAVLALASAGECWSLGGHEVGAAKRGIHSWAAKNGLQDLPVAALDASSGGYFVSRLAVEMSFAAVVIMISEGTFGPAGAPLGYPPTMFLHMPKDRRRAALVQKNMEMLRSSGVEVRELRSLEVPLTPNLLSDRIPEEYVRKDLEDVQ